MGTTERAVLGQQGEQLSAQHLESLGYRIRHRNYQCRLGELDLVAEKDDIICFVEVRMRSRAVWGDPSQTVSFSKQRKVVRAAIHYLDHERIRNRMLRFDVISVLGSGRDARVEHIPNAFDAGM